MNTGKFNASGLGTSVSTSRTAFCFMALALGVVLCALLNLAWGETPIPVSKLFGALVEPWGEDSVHRVLWDLRVPRVFAALLSGVALAVSGLALQSVFRNPLCGPFVLGISSGASLGVALAMLAGFGFGRLGVLGAATVGAVAVTACIMGLASRFTRGAVLLVAGLLVGYFVDAMVSVIISGASAEALRVYVAWGMGSFGRLLLGDVWIFVLAVVVGLLLVVSSMRYLNAVVVGEDFARGLGVPVRCSKNCVLLGASILAGAVTAFCGPVAFVGIAVPHLAFNLFKTSNHRILLPGSALCGALLCLLACLFPVSIPLNAILSVVGVPVILYVILRKSHSGAM